MNNFQTSRQFSELSNEFVDGHSPLENQHKKPPSNLPMPPSTLPMQNNNRSSMNYNVQQLGTYQNQPTMSSNFAGSSGMNYGTNNYSQFYNQHCNQYVEPGPSDMPTVNGEVFDICRGQHVPVMGLKYFQVPQTNKYFVVATTPTRMYQFQGYVSNQQDRPLLVQVFDNYLNTPERFLELPSSWKYSSLAFYYSGEDQKALFPSQFGWLTEPGIYTGKIDLLEGDNDTVTVDCQLIAAPANQTPPRSAFLTQFHALLLYQKTQGQEEFVSIRF